MLLSITSSIIRPVSFNLKHPYLLSIFYFNYLLTVFLVFTLKSFYIRKNAQLRFSRTSILTACDCRYQLRIVNAKVWNYFQEIVYFVYHGLK